MPKDFENYIEQLAKDLHDAAAMKAWDIPIQHRTKDSISAYRAAVGIVGAVMLKTLEKHRNPIRQDATYTAKQVEPDSVQVAPEPVVEETAVAEAPLAAPQSLFSDEPSPEPRRRRRNQGENDAA
jgi:hypothetical protein